MTDRERITYELFREVARENGWWVSGDGRVGETDAAKLLGWTPESLRNARQEGRSPAFYRVGGAGHKVSYRLTDLAAWLELHHEAG